MTTRLLLTAFLAFSLSPLVNAEKKEASESIKVMSYNIRYDNDKDGTNCWVYRAPATVEMVKDQNPDIIGFQEVMPLQIKMLSYYLEDYKYVGVGRDDGKSEGEYLPIYYNKQNISVNKSGTFWLSDTPEKPSSAWGAENNRIVTWAVMKTKSNGKRVCVVNTHLDDKSEEARKNSVLLIIEKLKEINSESLPVVLLGDFNMEVSDLDLKPLKAVFSDARSVAVKTDESDTYHGWGKFSKAVDYIWLKAVGSCTEFDVVTKEYNKRVFISDHYPVQAVLFL